MTIMIMWRHDAYKNGLWQETWIHFKLNIAEKTNKIFGWGYENNWGNGASF
jgi:hypothetical protein